MKRNRIHLEVWNSDTDEWEWRDFSASDIEDLLDKEIIDVDTLGYCMKDEAAFAKTFESLNGATYAEFVEAYLSNTTMDIWFTKDLLY